MWTGVPTGVSGKSASIVSFGRRMHPCEAALPIDEGSFVPWIPIGPPCAQFVSTGENALIPSAAGPKGPDGSLSVNR